MPPDAAAPPNTPFAVQESLCTAKPCLICWLQQKVKATPETQAVSFSTTPLQVNIVGVRSENSLTNAFDDLMVVFFQLLPPGAKETFDKAVERELVADLREVVASIKKSTAGPIKYVACSQRGVWVTAVFTATTDPGFQDSPAALEKNLDEAKKELAKRTEEVEEFKPIVEPLAQAKAKADVALAAFKGKKTVDPGTLDLPGAVDGIAPPEATKESLTRYLAAVKKKLNTPQKQLAKAEKDAKNAEAECKSLEKKLERKLAENEREERVEVNQGVKGWVDTGRAIVPTGHHAGVYSYYLHNAGSAKKFPRSTVALYVPAISPGLRLYSVEFLCQSQSPGFFKEFGGEGGVFASREVRQVWSSAGKVVRKLAPETAKLELALKPPPKEEEDKEEGERDKKKGTPPPPVREAFLVEAESRKPLSESQSVVLVDAIHGTNMHRAHNVEVAADGKRLKGRVAKGKEEVNDWSEGCQTYPDFNEFNAFIRLCAVSKRWLCASKDASKLAGPACACLVAGSGPLKTTDPLSSGEEALVTRFGLQYFNQVLSLSHEKEADELSRKLAAEEDAKKKLGYGSTEQKKLEELKAREAATEEARKVNPKIQALSPDEQKELRMLQGKADKLAALEGSITKTQKELDAIQASLCDFNDELRLPQLPGEIETLTKAINQHQKNVDKARSDIEKLKKDFEQPAKVKKPADKKALENQLAAKEKALEGHEKKKTEAEAQKKAKEEEKAELEKRKGLSEENEKKRRELIRNRAQTFQADFLRTCDLFGKCDERFSYTLIELPGSDLQEIRSLYADGRNTPWKGEFVMGDTSN